MPIVAQDVDAVLGIDTHRDTHQVELTSPLGVKLAQIEVPNSSTGFTQLGEFIARHSPGPRLIAGVEGTRSYGIGISRFLTRTGIVVVEVDRPERKSRRGKGKSDDIDAHLAAVSVLGMTTDRLPQPRADGDREALRILLVARQEMTTTNTGQTNRLRALLLAGGDTDRDLARGRLTTARLLTLARRRQPLNATREQAVRHGEIRRLATSLRQNQQTLRDNKAQLTAIVDDLAPTLIARPGLGPVTAAQILLSWSHPGRVRDEAAFAMLAGTCPLPASSGQTVRHRLNRGGDRALNRAIHTIALTRWRCDPRTHTYIAHRRAQGKSDREIRRCLKRYITRELYRALATP